jgi:hypothetical protein
MTLLWTWRKSPEKSSGDQSFRFGAGLPIRTGTWIVFPHNTRSEYFDFGLPNPAGPLNEDEPHL